MNQTTLLLGDCLERMAEIPDGSVDMVAADLPYGTTSCRWDSVIPFEPLWAAYRRICKRNAAIVLFGCEPFSSFLRMSNIKWFKYDWIWDKKIPSGMSYARHRPMQQNEIISVFCESRHKYNPQMTKREKPIRETKGSTSTDHASGRAPKFLGGKSYNEKNPTTILHFPKVPNSLGTLHPTQKPVALMEYLIRTYSNEGDTILDNTMGSGTTGVACVNTSRHFIGIERDPEYFRIAETRINAAKAALATKPVPQPDLFETIETTSHALIL